MSQEETRKVAQMWFDALDKGDMETAIGCLADDIEWVNLPKIPGVSDIIPWIGTAIGIQEVLKQFSTRDGVVEVKQFKPVDLVVEGNIAVGTVHDISTVLATGLDFEILFASWMEIRDGKIAKWKSYCDPSPIIAAFHGDVSQRLIAAVQTNDVKLMQKLISGYRGNPNTRDPETGLTLLMMAACQANLELVRVLLDAGADVWAMDAKTGATALHKTCQGGNVEIARLLLERGSFIDAVTPTMGHIPVMDALWYKWPDLVQLFVDEGQNLYLDTHYGFTIDDHIAYELNVNQGEEKEKFEKIKTIIDQGREKAQAEVAKQTVMAAVRAENPDFDAIKRLIDSGADVNTVLPHTNTFEDGHTPLLVAARNGLTDVVRELLQAGAKVRVEDWVFKGAPIHKATYNGYPEILQMLVDHPDVDLNVQGQINGYTPLHDALWHGFTECAKILVNASARLDLRGHDGKLPIDIAIEVYGEDADLVKLIRSKS